MKRYAWVIGLALVASVALANYATARYQFIPVGFGQEATAGTIFAGLCLALRDGLQDLGGRWAVGAAILAGALVSVITSNPSLALASGAAFIVSEVLDAGVYTPIRRRAAVGSSQWAGAVTASNLVGTLADTVVFLGLAFGWSAIAPAVLGQLIGKAYPTVVYLIGGWIRRALSVPAVDVART